MSFVEKWMVPDIPLSEIIQIQKYNYAESYRGQEKGQTLKQNGDSGRG